MSKIRGENRCAMGLAALSLIALVLLSRCDVSKASVPVEAMYSNPGPSPVLLVPGLGGSRAYTQDVRFPKEKPVISWLSYFNMLQPNIIVKMLGLTYDASTGKFSDQPNNHVDFPGFGETWSIESLHDTFNIGKTYYFRDLVNELTKMPHLRKNFTLRGVPYDFRRYPLEWTGTYKRLRSLIEETYANANNKRVLLVAHSMGNILLQHFFKFHVPVEWQQRYIRGYISLSAPYGGSVKSLLTLLSGNTMGASFLDALKFRNVQRLFPSAYLMLPHPKIYGKSPIVITPKRNYTAWDYKDIFTDAGFPHGYALYNKVVTRDTIDPEFDPSTGIAELYCVYSENKDKKTTEALRWAPGKKFPDDAPEQLFGPGDGTVSVNSASACKKWKNAKTIFYDNVSHHAQKDSAVIREIIKIVMAGDKRR